jgi:hypothetical protein
MKICWKFADGKNGFCLNLPGYGGLGSTQIPTRQSKNMADNQEPGIYPDLLTDASVINAVNSALASISDSEVRDALQNGIHAAVKALQKRAGKDVSITLEETRKAA